MANTSNLFELAAEFYQKNPQKHDGSKKRTLAVKELLLVIDTAPFLADNQKEQMSFLIPMYSLPVLEKVRHSLIRQGVIFLKLNPNQTPNLKEWLSNAKQI